MRFSLVSDDAGQENIIAWVGGEILEASTGHPNFDRIKDAVVGGTDYTVDELKDLFSAEHKVARKFEQLSERVFVRDGQVYFDGDPVDSVLTEQIMRFLEEDVADWAPLVAFWEKLAQNPSEHSREQLYGWLKATGGFTITNEGDFIAYKGVKRSGDQYVSVHSGEAIRNGEEINGQVPNMPGDVISMPRTKVTFDPKNGCSFGLHAGTWNYAKDFGEVVLTVKINPRDVVSVPVDCLQQKLRTCRYEVIDVVSEKNNVLVAESTSGYDHIDDEDDEDYEDVSYYDEIDDPFDPFSRY